MSGDIWYYTKVACCILTAAERALEADGLPLPARREVVQWGRLGDPSCCDALLVSAGPSRKNLAIPGGQRNCGPQDRIVTWTVRIFRPVCLDEPDCGTPAVASCADIPRCPGDPWNGGDVANHQCNPASRAEQQALLFADRACLEQRIGALVDDCLCDNTQFPNCDRDCVFHCTEPTTWTASAATSGGGCAGTILTLETHTLGSS